MSNRIERQLHEGGPEDVVVPAYDDYCFVNVPGTVGDVFGVDLGRSLPAGTVNTDGVDTVVLVLIDGLGLHRYRRDGPDVPLLRRISAAGEMTPLTSIFPSETAPAIATVHTGRTPAEHGLLGGLLHLSEHGVVLQSLSFARRDGPPESAGGVEGVDTTVLNDGPTVYERLAEADVESHIVQPSAILENSYADAMLTGGSRHGYDDAAEAGKSIQSVLVDANEPTYLYCYLPHVDVLSHRHGPDAKEYREGLATACAGIERGLDALATKKGTLDPARTLVLVVADHGHVPINPAMVTDLMADPVVNDSLDHENGAPIRPTGGPRSAFLHVRDDRIDRVRTHLDERFDGHVFGREIVLDELSLFGPEPTARARQRCGDIVCLPHDGGVWFGGTKKRSLHGGLTPREMLIPCVAARLSEL